MAGARILVDLNGDLEISSADAERRRILGLLDHPAVSTIEIEISGERLTQPALQIFFATLREIRDRDHALQLGPRASALNRCRMEATKDSGT